MPPAWKVRIASEPGSNRTVKGMSCARTAAGSPVLMTTTSGLRLESAAGGQKGRRR